MSAITEALNELKDMDTRDRADRQQLRRRARRHADSDVKGAKGWFSSPTAGSAAESLMRESKADIKAFTDKFGQDTYDAFRKSGQRLKNAGMSPDMLSYVHDDAMTKKKLDDILFNLANKRTVDSEDPSKVEGKYRFLGSAKGYDVYQPLDALGSMNLGVGSGWCTTGRYGHYGEKNFKPSLKDAEEHWDEYTKQGVKFYYFLQDGEGKYALAVYPNRFDFDNLYTDSYYANGRTNFELYNQQDELDYSAKDSLPLSLVPETFYLNLRTYPIADGLVLTSDRKTVIGVGNDPLNSNLHIPQGITEIDNSAFEENEDIEEVDMASSVISIGDNAFLGCQMLGKVTLPDSVIAVGEEVFCDCVSLETVSLSDRIESMGGSIFDDCDHLESIEVRHAGGTSYVYGLLHDRYGGIVAYDDTPKDESFRESRRHPRRKGWHLNADAGNVEADVAMFNHAMGADASLSGPGMHESLNEDDYDYRTGEARGDDIFDTSTLGGFSYYTGMFPGSKYRSYMRDKKNMKGDIVMMSPDEYYSLCAEKVFGTTAESLKQTRGEDPKAIDELKKVITEKKRKFPMAFIDLSVPTQEGLHRMYAAGELFGWGHKFPVLVVDYADRDRAEKEKADGERRKTEEEASEALTYALGPSYGSMDEFRDQLQDELNNEFNGYGSDEPDVKYGLKETPSGVELTVGGVTVSGGHPRIEKDEAYRWHPSRTAAKAFAQKMDRIDDFCAENGIDASRGDNSYYFTLNGQKYRVSNHSVEASNRGAYDWKGDRRRPLYHPEGREDDVIYINAGKTRIMDIYNDLKSGYALDGNGNRTGSPAKAPDADAGKGSVNTQGAFRVSGPLMLSNDGRTIVGVADKGIRSVSIPEGVTDIAYGAFYGCDRLESVFIPLGARIGYKDLAGIPSLKHVILQKGTPSNVWNSFNSGCRGLVSYGDKPEISESAGGGGHTPGESLDESKDDRKRFFDWLSSGYSDSIYKFDELRQSIKAPYNDFYWWMKNSEPSEFSAYVDELAAERKQRDDADYRARKGAKLVYEDSEWKVYHITSYEASCKYGKNTKWCIAGSRRWSSNGNGKDFWDDYHGHGIDFYYFIRGNDEKYALTVYPEDGHVEIYNSEDVSVPYIPDAPKIPSIKADYSGSSQSGLGKLCMALATGKMSQRIAFALLGDTVAAYRDAEVHPQFMDSSPSGIDAVCSILDSSIPDDYLEYSAAWARKDDGRKLTSDETELIRDCGASPDGESWDGDLTDLDPQSEYEWVNSMSKKAVCSPSNPAFAGKKYFLYCTFDDGTSPELQGEEDWLGLIRELMEITGIANMLQSEIHSYFAGYREAYPHDGSNIDAFILMCVNDGLTAIAMGNSIKANGGGADISPSELRDEFARLGASRAFLDGVGKDERYTQHLPA